MFEHCERTTTTTDARALVYYKLTFEPDGSGELMKLGSKYNLLNTPRKLQK